MYLYFCFVVVALLLVGWILKGLGHQPDVVRARLPMAVGAFLLIGSFMGMPWLYFVPLESLVDVGQGEFVSYAFEQVAGVSNRVGLERLAKLFFLIARLGYLPGWAVFILLLAVQAFFASFVLALVGLVGLFSALWFPISLFIEHQRLQRMIGRFLAVVAFSAAILLLLQMPTIDALASTGSFEFGLLALVAGVQMGWGVWVAWLGLLLIGLGNLLSLNAVGQSSASSEPDLYEW